MATHQNIGAVPRWPGVFLVENTPSDLRNNICAWDILPPCPEWFETAHVIASVHILLWVLIAGFFLSLVLPFVLSDYRRTFDFIATQSMPPVSIAVNSKAEQTEDEAQDSTPRTEKQSRLQEIQDQLLESLSPAPQKSSLKTWAVVDIFTVGQAACLWCGIEPSNSYMHDKTRYSEINAAEQLIVSEMKAGQIQLDTSDNALSIIGDHSSSLVSRTDLLGIAERKQAKPRFLFPDNGG